MTEDRRPFATCHGCGAIQAPDARFCAECGAEAASTGPLTAAPPTQQMAEEHQTMILAQQLGRDVQMPLLGALVPVEMAVDGPEGSPRRPRRRLIMKSLAAALALAGVALLALNDFGTHDRLARSQEAYSASQNHLQTTQVNLANTVSRLTGVQSNLTSAEATLTTTKNTLAARVQELAGVRNNLTDVKSSLTIKSGQIETLKSCLNGVSIAMTDLAYSDYDGAISALNAVKVSCNSAYALL